MGLRARFCLSVGSLLAISIIPIFDSSNVALSAALLSLRHFLNCSPLWAFHAMMSLRRQNDDIMRPKNSTLINKAFKLHRAGKDKAEIARLCKVSLRTVQRWLSDEGLFSELEEAEKAVIETDPLIFTITEVRAQVQEILDYRDSQKVFALEMG